MTSVRDIIIIAVLLFAVAVAVLVTVNTGHIIIGRLQLNPSFNATNSSMEVLQSGDASLNYTDGVYFVGFIALFFAIIIFGYLVGGYGIFSVIYFILIIIFVIISYVLQVSWITIAENSNFITTTAALPLTNFIMSNLAMFVAVMGLVGLLAIYAKPYFQGGP